jgi:hypothetical protein
MRSSRDTYGIKTLLPGRSKHIPGATREMFRQCMAQYFRRHAWVRHKAFETTVADGGLLVERIK